MPSRPAPRRSRMPRTRRPAGVPAPRLIASLALSAGLLLLILFTQSLLARVGSAETLDASPATALAAECAKLWAERAPSIEDGLAPATASQRAIQTCHEADDAAESLAPKIAARWRAMRSAHYLSAFTSASQTEKTRALEEAAELADRTLAELTLELGDKDLLQFKGPELAQRLEAKGFAPADIARLHFWTAIVWGAKGQTAGLLKIVREGVANRMHNNARIAIRLDPSIDRGGAYRLLSRINAEFPRVPFVSGWVDREKTLPQARKALAQDPEEPGNKLILALALRDQGNAPRSRIEALLQEVIEAPERPTRLAEDWAIQKQAREELAQFLEQS